MESCLSGVLQNHLGGGGWQQHWLLMLLAVMHRRIWTMQKVGVLQVPATQTHWNQEANPLPPVISLVGIKGYHLKLINQIVEA